MAHLNTFYLVHLLVNDETKINKNSFFFNVIAITIALKAASVAAVTSRTAHSLLVA